MKNGTSIVEIRRKFFENISTNCSFCDKIQNMDNTRCVVIYKDIVSNIMLGISQCGECVFKDKSKVYIIKEKNDFLYCSKLVGIPYDLIYKHMYDEFIDIICLEKFDISKIFPFFEIVEFIFNFLIDDYWIDLSWLWYQKFSIVEKRNLVDTLQKLIKEKKISQRNRQKIKKEFESIMKTTS